VLAVVFRIQESEYALAAQSVVEVIPQVLLRPVPAAPDWLLGVFAYRGNLTPVIDLCAMIANSPCSRRLSSRIVLIHCTAPGGKQATIGLLAEHVTSVRHLEATTLSAGSLGTAAFLGRMMLDGSKLVHVIDQNALAGAFSASLSERVLHSRLGSGEADREHTEA
jgi:chemotaxis-related protein WspB